jgi:hypothetical protein
MKHVDTRTETRENIAPFSNREREEDHLNKIKIDGRRTIEE